MPALTLSKAINAGLRRVLEDDPKTIVMGQDVGALGGVFRVTDGLQREFGPERVIDTPLAEASIVGTAIGLALRGYRPLCEIQFDGFVYPGFSQIVSQLAKLRARSGGKIAVPVVIRIPVGGGIGAVEHHSESNEAYFTHTAGLRVVCCSSPQDGHWMIRQAAVCGDPVIFYEPKRRYWTKADVADSADDERVLPLDRARVVRPGTDLTLLTYGGLVQTCLAAAQAATEDGRDIEVIDLRTLSPLDLDTIARSVGKTGRAVVAHEAPTFGGLGAEIGSAVTERCFYALAAPVLRVGGFNTPYPPAKFEQQYLPGLDRVLDAVDRAFVVSGPAMATRQFRLPDVGEGLLEAEIVTWHVAAGDAVARDQVIVEIETAKSVVELPSPWAGTVAALLVRPGETVPVGTPIIAIEAAGGEAADGAAPGAEPAPSPESPAPSVLVGYGPAEDTARRRRKAAAVVTGPGPGGVAVSGRAAPPVRKFARDLGVDLAAVTGTGPGGTVTREDVRRHGGAVASIPSVTRPVTGPQAAGETRVPVTGVRKATAAAMVSSAFTAPHVTEFVTVDVTRAVRLVDKLRRESAFDGTKPTMLLLAARALVTAVREFPDINASWDGATHEIVLHRQVNLGIAAATPRGLLVPNIKDAGSLSLPQLAVALADLVRTARAGRTSPHDLAQGTITITNIGVFGVDSGTPILNPGEAAILCLGAVRQMPWSHKGKVALRQTTQLALSFDHRLIDGELGSRVLARVARILANPRWELLLS